MFFRKKKKKKRRLLPRAPALTEAQILDWADAYHRRTGRWPTKTTGKITGAVGERWATVNQALYGGYRGLSGGSSLARLLLERRGKRSIGHLPLLREKDILAWADAHYQRTGNWPTFRDGRVPEAPGETWARINTALSIGYRSHSGGSTLARLLEARRGIPPRVCKSPLREEDLLVWADAHQCRTGQWPAPDSGRIPEAPLLTWLKVDRSLQRGMHSLPGGSSLVQLLSAARGVRNAKNPPPLNHPQILAWADAFHWRRGHWPTALAGPIAEAPGETWQAVDMALSKGQRGLAGGSSLAKLLAELRGHRHRLLTPRLTEARILQWADAYRRRTGDWPARTSGSVPEAGYGETWPAIDAALNRGGRGLPGGSSLADLLARRRGRRNTGRKREPIGHRANEPASMSTY